MQGSFFKTKKKSTRDSSNWKIRIFHLCSIVTHPLGKIIPMFYRFHPHVFLNILFQIFYFDYQWLLLLLAGIFLQKGQVVVKCGLELCFHKLWVDSEKIRSYYCVATVRFTNMTLSLWIGWALSLLRKKPAFDFEWKIYTDHFLKYILWYNDCNWCLPTLQLL